MVFVLVVLVLIVLAIILAGTHEDISFGCFLFGMIGICIISVVVFTSYFIYLDDRSFYDSGFYIKKAAIEEYINKTKIDGGGELTDLKYRDRMEYLYKLIDGLRHSVEQYNQDIIEKRKLNNNILFSWIIIAPDEDMKLLDFDGNKYINSLCKER